MSQEIFDKIVPETTSGNELATILNLFKDAVVSGFSGEQRPSQLQEGGLWIDNTGRATGKYILKFYNGQSDLDVLILDFTTGKIELPGTSNVFEILKASDDELGPELKMLKRRISGSGQTKAGDEIGSLVFSGRRDDTIETVLASIRVKATDDITNLTRGSEISFYLTKDGTTDYKEVLHLNGNGVGIGTTDPQSKLHVTDTSMMSKKADDTMGFESIVAKERLLLNGQVQENDTIGVTRFNAKNDQGNFQEVANIEIKSQDNQTVVDRGGKISFSTANKGNADVTEKMSIADDVNIASNLTVAKDIQAVNINAEKISAKTYEEGTVVVTKDPQIELNQGGDQSTAIAFKAGMKVTMTDATDYLVAYSADGLIAGEEGAEEPVVLGNKAQDVKNKAIISPSKLEVKKDTFENLKAWAALNPEHSLVYATDTKKSYQVVDGLLKAIGGGGAGVGGWATTGEIGDYVAAESSVGADASVEGDSNEIVITQGTTASEIALNTVKPEGLINKNNWFKINYTSSGTNFILSVNGKTTDGTWEELSNVTLKQTSDIEKGVVKFELNPNYVGYRAMIKNDGAENQTILKLSRGEWTDQEVFQNTISLKEVDLKNLEWPSYDKNEVPITGTLNWEQKDTMLQVKEINGKVILCGTVYGQTDSSKTVTLTIPNVTFKNKNYGADYNTSGRMAVVTSTIPNSGSATGSYVLPDGRIVLNRTVEQTEWYVELNNELESWPLWAKKSTKVSLTSFDYTPWAINSGKRDANGNNAIMQGLSTNTLTFDMSEVMTCTLANKERVQVGSLPPQQVSRDGTYNVFVNPKTKEVFLVENKVAIQPKAPDAPTMNDMWLDTSQEPLKFKVWTNTSWMEIDYIWMGSITVTSGNIAQIDNKDFNNHDISVPNNTRPVELIESWDNGSSWYRIYSDGWLEQGGELPTNSTGNYSFLKPFKNSPKIFIDGVTNSSEAHSERARSVTALSTTGFSTYRLFFFAYRVYWHAFGQGA